MKRITFYLFCCLSAVLFASCGEDGPFNKTGAITGTASHISCRNAEISGKVNLPATTATDLTIGVLYSTDSGVLLGSAVQIQAKSFDSDYNFTVGTEVLEPETTYYYRTYFSQNGEITYGDTKSFTTLPVSSMIKTEDATDIEATVATLHATLDLTDCRYDTMEYGFQYTSQDEQPVSVVASNLSDKAFSAIANPLVPTTQYSYCAYVILDERIYLADNKVFSTKERVLPDGAVEMGLSVAWASCNIGASTPEGFGDYYAWGETETKANYSWSTYKFGHSSSGPFSKYNGTGTLDLEDDVAHVKLGGTWRMPTDEEWVELINNCSFAVKYQNGNAIGWKLTSKKTGNSIFFPFSGYSANGYVYDVDIYGHYWSSTRFNERKAAWAVIMGSNRLDREGHDRCSGRTVRPVCD